LYNCVLIRISSVTGAASSLEMDRVGRRRIVQAVATAAAATALGLFVITVQSQSDTGLSGLKASVLLDAEAFEKLPVN